MHKMISHSPNQSNQLCCCLAWPASHIITHNHIASASQAEVSFNTQVPMHSIALASVFCQCRTTQIQHVRCKNILTLLTRCSSPLGKKQGLQCRGTLGLQMKHAPRQVCSRGTGFSTSVRILLRHTPGLITEFASCKSLKLETLRLSFGRLDMCCAADGLVLDGACLLATLLLPASGQDSPNTCSYVCSIALLLLMACALHTYFLTHVTCDMSTKSSVAHCKRWQCSTVTPCQRLGKTLQHSPVTLQPFW